MSKLSAGVFALAWCVLWGARPAGAQTITLPITGLTHSRSNRESNLLDTSINIADCVDDDRLSFTLSVTNPKPEYSLQVWAGLNCDQLLNRTSTTTLSCRQLGEDRSVTGPHPPSIAVSVRDLLHAFTKASVSDIDPTAGTSALPNACLPILEAPYAQSIDVYFMFVDAANNIQGSFATWGASYKLTPPPTPSINTVTSGEAQIQLEFSESPNDPTLNAYQFFCDPSAEVGSADAGTADPVCGASTVLVAGGSANAVPDLKCGSASKATTNGSATGLTNGISYNIAMVAVDIYDNVSEISNVVCQAPQQAAASAPASPDASSSACSVVGGIGACDSRWPALAVLSLATCLLRRRRSRGRVVRDAEG